MSPRLTLRLASAAGTLFLVLLSPRFATAQSFFVRGDANADGAVDVADPLFTLFHLFRSAGGEPDCEDALDADDSGEIDITDAIDSLTYLFLAGTRPREPFPDCGRDPTADGVTCRTFRACEQPVALQPPAVLPLADSIVATERITLEGMAEPGSSVEIAGGRELLVADVDANGDFRTEVSLERNRLQRLFLTAVRDGVRSPPAPVEVIQDATPPSLFVDNPVDGVTVLEDTITVFGRVGDVLSGFSGLDVLVNGEPASVVRGQGTNGTFDRAVPLVLGENRFRVTATDFAGNSVVREVVVVRLASEGRERLELAPGSDRQQARIRNVLPEPISVTRLDAAGDPVAGADLVFRVTRSDGELSLTGNFDDVARRLTVTTDAGGQARVWWKLGTDAGCANNRLVVSSAAVEFSKLVCASALPGAAVQINIGSGNDQRVEAGATAPERLEVWVSDSCNGVAGISVTFTVTRGEGLVDGARSVTVPSGPTGHASVTFESGVEGGVQRVEATFEGNEGSPAVFTAHGVLREPGASTTFRGLVLDNASQPIGGATVLLLLPGGGRAETKTTVEGQFLIEDIPGAGIADLYIVGLRAATLGGEPIEPGSFPVLHFEPVVVPGAENALSPPVLLPPLDPANAREYRTNEDTVLTVAGIDGLEMTIGAGSMRLPDGTPAPDGTVVSLDQVHADDIPMPMPNGAASPFAWTLQPAGATFDPPVAIRYPNMAGLAPGAAAYFMTFDHDTGQFEIVATGAVTDDGAEILSDPGAGLTLAGWGGSCPPYFTTGSCARVVLTYGTSGDAGSYLPGWTDPDRVADPARYFTFLSHPARDIFIRVAGEPEELAGRDLVFEVDVPPGYRRDRLPAPPPFGRGNGRFFSFTPVGVERSDDHYFGGAAIQAATFRIRVYDARDPSFEIVDTFSQDIVDRMRQEYVDASLAVAGFPDRSLNEIGAPPREAVGWPRRTDSFTRKELAGPYSCCNACSDPDRPCPNYWLVNNSLDDPDKRLGIVWDNGYSSLARDIQRSYAQRRASLEGSLTEAERNGLYLTGGHRSPSHQRRISSTITSFHQFGQAVDLKPQAADEELRRRAFYDLYTAALDSDLVIVDSEGFKRVLLERGRTNFFPRGWRPPEPGQRIAASVGPISFEVEFLDAVPSGSSDAERVAKGSDGIADSFRLLDVPDGIELPSTFEVPHDPPARRTRFSARLALNTDTAGFALRWSNSSGSFRIPSTSFFQDDGEPENRISHVHLSGLPRAATDDEIEPNPGEPRELPARLDDSWTVTVGRQTFPVDADGSFRIDNIWLVTFSRPFLGRPSFPFLRVRGTRTAGGETLYTRSRRFQLVPRQTVFLGEMPIADVPPRTPRSIQFEDGPTEIQGGQTLQLVLSAAFGDGSREDITPSTRWTSYRSSNPRIASVDDDGLVTARAPGAVAILATNEGATAVRRLSVRLGVRITGRVTLPDDRPVSGVVVRSETGETTLTAADGLFVLDVPELDVDTLRLTLEYTIRGENGSTKLDVSIEGIDTDVGDIVVGEQKIVSGRVTLPDGTPVDGATVLSSFGDAVLTAADGTFTTRLIGVRLVDPRLTLQFEIAGKSGSAFFTVRSGDAVVDVGDVVVRELRTITGGVSLPDGSPAGGASVTSEFGDVALAGADGTFEVDVIGIDLRSFELAIEFELEGVRYDATIEVSSPGDSVDLGSIRLRRLFESSVSGRALLPDDTAAAGALVRSLFGEDIVAAADGAFTIALRWRSLETPSISLVLESGGSRFVASRDIGATSSEIDLGDIKLAPMSQTRYPGKKLVTGNGPISVALGDLDGNGSLDVVTADALGPSVSVHLGRGGAEFDSRRAYPGGIEPEGIAIGDLDGDSVPDLAVTNYGSELVSIYLGAGDGTLSFLRDVQSGEMPTAIEIADLNSDGLADLLVANSGIDDVTVLLGTGDAEFFEAHFAVVGDQPSDLGVGDVNGDRILDFVVANPDSSDISVVEGIGDGTFETAVNFPVRTPANALVLRDLDADGALDIAFAAPESGEVIVLLGDGSGAFSEDESYPTGGVPESMAAADLDADGVLDLVSATTDRNEVVVLRGNGDGTFDERGRFDTGVFPISIASGDVNGDHRVDLAIANEGANSVSLLLGRGDGTFLQPPTFPAGTSPETLRSGDVDGDGIVDLVVVNSGSSDVTVHRGSGDGTFLEAESHAVGQAAEGLALADLDGDATLDIVTVNFDGDDVTVLLGAGNGDFPARAEYDAGVAPSSVIVSDVDRDTFLDLVVTSSGSGEVSILPGVGGGSFAAARFFAAGDTPVAVAAADVDADDDIDLAVANVRGQSISILLGDGQGGFGAAPTISTGSLEPEEVTLGDFTGDRVPDLIVLPRVQLYHGRGDGSFLAVPEASAGVSPVTGVLTDLDADLLPDLVVANFLGNDIAILQGREEGGFEAPALHAAGSFPSGLVVADFDGNGLPDIAVANRGSDDVSVLLHR